MYYTRLEVVYGLPLCHCLSLIRRVPADVVSKRGVSARCSSSTCAGQVVFFPFTGPTPTREPDALGGGGGGGALAVLEVFAPHSSFATWAPVVVH